MSLLHLSSPSEQLIGDEVQRLSRSVLAELQPLLPLQLLRHPTPASARAGRAPGTGCEGKKGD